MSTYIRPGVKVTIHQMEGEFAPRPLPLENDFSSDKEYEVMGLHCPSETSEAYLILINDKDQMWFISNRHVRVVREEPPLHHSRNGATVHSAFSIP